MYIFFPIMYIFKTFSLLAFEFPRKNYLNGHKSLDIKKSLKIFGKSDDIKCDFIEIFSLLYYLEYFAQAGSGCVKISLYEENS